MEVINDGTHLVYLRHQYPNGVIVHVTSATFGKARLNRVDDPGELSYDSVW
jgi:hypothetical protein